MSLLPSADFTPRHLQLEVSIVMQSHNRQVIIIPAENTSSMTSNHTSALSSIARSRIIYSEVVMSGSITS
jgi:hypothetical protein